MPQPRSSKVVLEEIKPIAERLGADERFAGRGVTIAFLDAGFHAHSDLIKPRNRVKAFHDVLSRDPAPHTLGDPDGSSWHGMMTSVVACGNGERSQGRYKGLAHEAELVFVKVGSVSRIRHDDLTLGIEWVCANRAKYGINILNISAGGDYEASYLWDSLSRAAESAVRQGIVVVCAAGNSGNNPLRHAPVPPASCPAVITVGGFDDFNDPTQKSVPYHSSYGPTLDGLTKPEVIAPAIRVAAPILPGTPTAKQAALIAELAPAADEELKGILEKHAGADPEFDAVKHLQPYQIRQVLATKKGREKVISKHYKEVDGTSFAAPIVTSVVAQILEARPDLSPQAVKQILVHTAKRMPDVPFERQGWGIVQPREAVARALAWPKPDPNIPW